MGITKNRVTSGNSGAIKGDGTYLKKGGKVGKMMYGGKPTMKKGGAKMSKMKKGM